MRAPSVTRCRACAMCARIVGCGFTATTRLHCTDRDRDVGPDDGCTFGLRGEPMPGIVPCEADVGGYKPPVQGDRGW